MKVLLEELAHNMPKRLEQAKQMQDASKEPADPAGVAAAVAHRMRKGG